MSEDVFSHYEDISSHRAAKSCGLLRELHDSYEQERQEPEKKKSTQGSLIDESRFFSPRKLAHIKCTSPVQWATKVMTPASMYFL